MLKALRGMRNGEGMEYPSQPTIGGLGQWSNYIIIYEGDVKYFSPPPPDVPPEVILGMGQNLLALQFHRPWFNAVIGHPYRYCCCSCSACIA